MSSMARIADVTQGNDTQPPDPARVRAADRCHRVRRSWYIAERRAAVAEALAAGYSREETADLIEMSLVTVRNDIRWHNRVQLIEVGASLGVAAER